MTGDDAADGYIRGALWINTASSKLWWCADPSTGAAVWALLPNVISAFIQTVLDDADTATARATLGAAPASDFPIAFPGFKNRLINGNFDLWQRATSLGSGTGWRYCADRWASYSAGSTYTVSQQAFSLGQTSVPGEPTYFHCNVVTSVGGAANFAQLLQCVEGVRTFAGKMVTVSFWAKADASKPMTVEFSQFFGSGGSPSSDVTGIGATKLNLTTSWQKFTVTAAIPGISGKTLGSSGDDNLRLIFWFDAGSNYNARTGTLGQQSGTFDIAAVQLEEGSAATPFEMRPLAAEMLLCQRYYWQTSGGVSIQAYGNPAA